MQGLSCRALCRYSPRMDQPTSNALLSSLLFVLLTVTYAMLTSSFPVLEDDGLFILGAWDAGTAHAPGYPLYILLSQPFLWLPMGTVAFKVHLLGAVLAALTITFLYLYLATVLSISKSASLGASLALAFSTLFFSQALIAEAYMLNVFLLSCLIWIPALKINLRLRFCLAGLLFGLALSNHWPLTLLLVPTLLAIYWPMLVSLRRSAIREIAGAAAGVLLGLTPYLWMFLSSSDAKFSHMGQFENLSNFVAFVLRDVYSGVDQSGATASDKLLFLEAYVLDFADQYSLFVLPIVLIGIFLQWRTSPKHLALGFTLVLSLPLALLLLLDFPYERSFVAAALAYPLPLYAVAAIWLALGLQFLHRQLPRPAHFILGVAVVGIVIFHNRDVAEEDSSNWSRNIAVQILYALPENSALFVSNNWSMAQISYLHYVEGVRPDVTLISEYGAFLPERFSYFLPDKTKIGLLRNYIGLTGRDLYALAPLTMVNAPTIDLGLFYAINGPWHTQDAVSHLREKPKGRWNQLYWRELVDRNIRAFSVEEVQASSEPELVLAFSRHLMNQDTFDSGLVAGLLSSIDQQVEGEDRFNRSEHALLKGSLMEATGNSDLAAEFYALAEKILPGSVPSR